MHEVVKLNDILVSLDQVSILSPHINSLMSIKVFNDLHFLTNSEENACLIDKIVIDTDEFLLDDGFDFSVYDCEDENSIFKKFNRIRELKLVESKDIFQLDVLSKSSVKIRDLCIYDTNPENLEQIPKIDYLRGKVQTIEYDFSKNNKLSNESLSNIREINPRELILGQFYLNIQQVDIIKILSSIPCNMKVVIGNKKYGI